MATKTFESQVTTNVTATTTSETVVATLTGVSTPRKCNVAIEGWVQFTTGAGTTALTLRIRRGSAITDTLVGEANAVQVSAAAGSTEDHFIKVADNGVDLANGTYVLTVQQTAASADGTALQGSITAACPD